MWIYICYVDCNHYCKWGMVYKYSGIFPDPEKSRTCNADFAFKYLISEIKSLKRQLSEIKQEKNTVDREKRDIG